MLDAPQIFLSYRRDDSADITGRIYDRLVQHFGKRAIFRDIDAIPLGVDFRVHIDQMVSQCNILLVIIGPVWITITDTISGQRRLDDPEDFVRLEVESALARSIPVVPLFVRGATVPKENELPGRLKDIVYRNGIPIRPDPDFHNDLDRLIQELESYLPASPLPRTFIKDPVAEFVRKAAHPELIRKVAVAELICIASTIISIWISGAFFVPLTATRDEIILYSLGCSLILAVLLGFVNWRVQYDELWISPFGGTILLGIIWAIVRLTILF